MSWPPRTKGPGAAEGLLVLRRTVRWTVSLFAAGVCVLAPLHAEEDRWTAEAFTGLTLRGLGPALMSGRIADIAKDPTDESVWYVAVASGGVWKTRNNGTTWTPIFDDQPSYSIGTVVVDPTNPHVVWVGTGENNSQRSVGWGDGVYKSLDGGETWRRMGLERSEHIGKIVLDPRDSDIVWVAAQGPLWAPGGERGLYKSLDGGETWALSLDVGENTGVTDVVLDPRDPDTLYAAAFQRRRRQWALVAGGPESALYKSTDGGASWRQLEHGLPGDDMGRIGLALSPQDPDVVYATIPAIDEGGFYRSENRGETWTKMSDYVAVDPQYYQEIFPDPHRFDRVYVMDVWIQVSDDGGATWRSLSSEHKHVDNHALLFDADDPEYLMVGCDGGIYESWDRGTTWRFVDNLAVTQFYRVGIDDAEPFYNVYGGTQDNDTQGGPSRTTFQHGIRNSDWFITVGGDGYQTRAEPGNPDILYSLWQYGGLVRHDKKSGEIVDLQPQPDPGEPPLRWQWDSPLLISPHDPTRVYFAAQKLFRTDDRGHAWRAVSPDLTRQLDRNRLEVMGTVWSVDSVWKNVFTSPYGSIVSFDESTRVEGLLYVGTDDGVIAVSENGGADWRRTMSEDIAGVPEMTYVSDLTASSHHDDRVYAAFNHHKSGDFAPYLLRSNDRGRRWKSIAHCVGVDISLRFLTTALERVNGLADYPERLHLMCAAIEDLPFREASFDVVVGNSLLHHLYDYEGVLSRLRSLLRPGGVALFSEPCQQGKSLIAFLLALVLRFDAADPRPSLDDSDRKIARRLIASVNREKTLAEHPERKRALEDKHVFRTAQLERVALRLDYQSFEAHNTGVPSGGYRRFVESALRTAGFQASLDRFAFVFDDFEEHYLSLLADETQTPHQLLVFRR